MTKQKLPKMAVLVLVEVTPVGSPPPTALLGFHAEVLQVVEDALREAALTQDEDGSYAYPWRLLSVRQAVAP